MENSFQTFLLNTQYPVVKGSESIKSVKFLLNFLNFFVLCFSKLTIDVIIELKKLENCEVAITNFQAILIRKHKRHASNIFT